MVVHRQWWVDALPPVARQDDEEEDMVDRSEPFLNHKVQDIGPISRERILKAIEEAEESFWATIAKAFPEITHGDVGPEWYAQREHDNNWAVVSWLDGNLDRHLLPFDGDIDDIEAWIWQAAGSAGRADAHEATLNPPLDIAAVQAGNAGGTVAFRVELTDGRVLAVGDYREPFCPRWSEGGKVGIDGWSVSLYANDDDYMNAAKDSLFLETEDKRPVALWKLLWAISSSALGCEECGHIVDEHDGTGSCPVDGCPTFKPKVPADFPVIPLRSVYEREEAERHGSLAQCGECGRYWDDAISTTYTPTPAGRCPFEYYH